MTSRLRQLRLAQPIRNLLAATSAMRKGDLQYRIQERRNDEIGHLIEAYNGMAHGMLEKDQVERVLQQRELDVSHASSADEEKRAVLVRVVELVDEFSAALGERPRRRSSATWEATAAVLAKLRPAEVLVSTSDSAFYELHNRVSGFVCELRAWLYRLCVLHLSVSTPPGERRVAGFRLA